MLSKKRSLVRAKASKVDTTLIVGKGGLGEEIFNQAINIIKKHEILKGKVLKNSILEAREVGEIIAEKIGAEMVCSIGNKFVIYKQNNNKKNSKKNNTNKPMKAIVRGNSKKIKRKENKRGTGTKIKAGKFYKNSAGKRDFDTY